MAFQTVFQRYEMKYLLTQKQKEKMLRVCSPYMVPDQYGRTTIRNLYFDTDHYLLVRRSLEKPVYKEKLRVRSYCQARPESMVFVELKKKYKKIVYKRRFALEEKTAMAWLLDGEWCGRGGQIGAEVDYVLRHYERLHPVVFLSYEREAFYAVDSSDFRVTFDEHILCRQKELSLEMPVYGTELLPPGMVLMEVKCAGGLPLWMTRILSAERIYQTSFSKYGTAYRTLIFPELRKEGLRYA